MVVLGHARHRVHFHSACGRGPESQIHGHTPRRATAVRSLEPGRKEVERAANPQTTLETRYMPNVADVPEYERGDVIFGHRRDRRDYQLLDTLAHVLGATEEPVHSQIEIAFQHEAARQGCGTDVVIRAIDERRRPRAGLPYRLGRQHTSADAMEGFGRPQLLRTLQVRVPGSDTHPRSGIHADTGAVGVQTSAAVVKVRPILVRLTA